MTMMLNAVQYPQRKPKDNTKVAGPFVIGSVGGYDDGWLARITLADDVHLQLFPKYGLVAMEICDNGNTNLPACCATQNLLGHLFRPGKTRVRAYTGDPKRDKHRFERARVEQAIRTLKEIAKTKAEEWKLSLGRSWED